MNLKLKKKEKDFSKVEKQERVEQSIRSIRTASQKIESVIRRVMNFSKPLEPKFKRVDIHGPIKEAIDLCRVNMRKKGIDLSLLLGDNLPECYAEPHLIEEVILNLLNNATDAMEDSGSGKMIRVCSHVQEDRLNVIKLRADA